MEPYQRPQVNTLRQRLNEAPHHIVALFGPRQTGKTTIVKQALLPFDPDHYWPLAVDDPNPSRPYLASDTAETTFSRPLVKDTHWLVQYWDAARREAERLGKFVLVFDEIQKIPRWSETVKGLWDADRARNCPLHVVILGSAPLLMQTGLSESLAGRFETIRVTHWSFKEMSEAFNFDLPTYFYFGGYPEAARYVHAPERWRAYILNSLVEPNIERDIPVSDPCRQASAIETAL